MSGQLSPQIEEDMLQYVYLFYLDFYFLIFRNGKKKMFVVMCSHLCEHDNVVICLNDPGGSLIVRICLPSAYIIMIY